jgi:hypothetical protein
MSAALHNDFLAFPFAMYFIVVQKHTWRPWQYTCICIPGHSVAELGHKMQEQENKLIFH